MIDDKTEHGVLTVDSPPERVARSAGGKGHNLYRLSHAGSAVPPWVVIGSDVFAAFRTATGLDQRIADALGGLRGDDVEDVAASIEDVADRIRQSFEATPLDEAAAAAIERAYRHLAPRPVAVRSSSSEEDSARRSFAGQHSSFLNVVGLPDVLGSVKRCWASAYSARSLTYRWLHDLPTDPIDMAVVLQVVVPAETSGVLFTANPLSGRRDEALISSVYGLGEGLVSGAIDADTVTIDRSDGTVKDAVVGQKGERVEASAEGSGCVNVAVEPSERLSLSPQHLDLLRRCAEQIESLFGAPQDVEWAIADDQLWILQSRPITNITADDAGEIRLWDNSNIIESYGGVTAPLTFSFARHTYYRVYRDYCELLGVPRRQLDRMDAWLVNMLGYFDGRVYYNVLNWYRVIRLLPAYRLNVRILAAAMGVRAPSPDVAGQQRPLECRSRLHEALIRARVAIGFGKAFLTVNRSVDRFLRDFHPIHARFHEIDYSAMSADEVYRHYVEIERTLLSRWGRTAVLDHVICLTYGVLHVLTERWMPDMPEWLRWQVVKVGADDVESTQPARRLTQLAQEVNADPELARLVRELTTADLRQLLHDATGQRVEWLRAQLDQYLDEFGDRNANELKLEEPDLRDDPAQLLSMLKDAADQREQAGRDKTDDPESYLDAHLSGWRRRLYDLVRRKVRDGLRQRERVRFARTRAFGVARRMFKAMGDGLERVGALSHGRDVFYLRLEELRGAFTGTIAHRELRPLAQLRRTQQDKQRLMPAPPSRFTTRGSVYWGEMRPDIEATGDAADGKLQGTPCSPGIAVGEARVVDKPRDVGANVLVTYRTDPGWVGVLPTATALLIERGSPLTHVAIVARELGVPTVVQIPELTRRIETGMTVTVDGGQGTVEIGAARAADG